MLREILNYTSSKLNKEKWLKKQSKKKLDNKC